MFCLFSQNQCLKHKEGKEMVENNTKIKKQDQKNVVQVTWSSKRPTTPSIGRNDLYLLVEEKQPIFLCTLTLIFM